MEQSLYQLYRQTNNIRRGTHFGVEIEIEGVSSDDVDDTFEGYAHVTGDGSLRNGIEIVTAPLNPKRLSEFCSLYTEWAKGQDIELSERTSTHVHVNVQDMNYEQMRSFLWLCTAVEGVLLEYCSTRRRNNTYCYNSSKTVNTISWLAGLLYRFQQNTGVYSYLQQAPKYTAIGLFRMQDYGTVEFRMFDGTTDGAHIEAWCDMIESLRSLAMGMTVEQLRDRKQTDGVLSLLTTAIKAQGTVPDAELSILLEKGIEMANDIVRPPMTREQLLEAHRRLFPDLAPEVLERGSFGPKLLALHQQGGLALVREHLSKFNAGDFNSAYGESGLFVLFTEMQSTPVQAAEIIVELRSVYNL